MDAPPGAEVWAWFNALNRTQEQIDAQWKDLCGILSGLLCASLNFIDNSNTVQPEYSFRPTFSPGISALSSSVASLNTTKYQIRYAALPREIVCTENLTPWKKLLPCHLHEGLGSLLNSGYIHSTNYHSIGIHVRLLSHEMLKSTSAAKKLGPSPQTLELRQTVNLVYDKEIMPASASDRDWSIRKMFGMGLNSACQLATSSRIYVDVTEQDFTLTPEPTEVITSQRGGAITQLAVYDVKNKFAHQFFSIAGIYNKGEGDEATVRPPVAIFMPPPLYAKRFLLGVGQERGKIMTKVTNTHWTAVNVLLQESIPWFVPVYLHTLTLKISGTENKIQPSLVKYIPGRLRERPSHLEIAFKCPTRVTVDISIDFDFVFLKWLEYPPDANHGQYIGSAILTAQLPIARNFTAIPVDGHLFSDGFNASRSSGYVIHMRTETLLITLPTPDFSMPYNVICLACTVVALAFGPIHNISTKKLTYKKRPKKSEGEESTGLRSRLKKLFSFRKNKTEKTEKTE